MNGKKVLAILAGILFFAATFIAGIYLGGKSAEWDIDEKIAKGEIFANPDNLKNNNSELSQDCNETVELSEYENERYNQEQGNKIAALEQISNEILTSYVAEKINNTKLYRKLDKKTGNEFMDKNFIEVWGDDYHPEEALNVRKIQEKIMAGDIFFQDIYGGRVYYARNYYNWTKDKIQSMVDIFGEGIGSNIPDIVFTDENNIFWYNSFPCSGGFRSEELISKEEFYVEYKCETLWNAIRNYNFKK